MHAETLLTPEELAVRWRDLSADPDSPEIGWEEWGWLGATAGRRALAMALTGMMRDGEITRPRAEELSRMVMRENARTLYALP